MAESFLSNENKAMIWQLLSENNAFNNIPNNSFDQVRKTYENILNQISTMQNINLTDKNKLTISEMLKQMGKYKIKKISRPLEEVKIQLDKDFENKQEEFINLVKRPTQAEIEFNDKTDTPLDNDDMESKLNNMMRMRQDELNQIIPENNNNNNNNIPENNNNNNNIPENNNNIPENNNNIPENNNNNNNLDCLDYMWSQWGDTTNKNLEISNLKEKKVSFELDKLDKLLLNQEIIMKLLNNLTQNNTTVNDVDSQNYNN